VKSHPLERICTHRSENFQLAFARRALHLLPAQWDCEFEASRLGIILRGETESALERATEWLREVYGEQLAIGPVSIRYQQGSVLEEPHMGVRVRCRPEDLDTIAKDLVSRGATILDEELGQAGGVVRATVPLTRLLGYSRYLAELTSDSAREVMWFSHYAPCDSPPTGDDAA